MFICSLPVYKNGLIIVSYTAKYTCGESTITPIEPLSL